MEVDWDLQAVVRGCKGGSSSSSTSSSATELFACSSPPSVQLQDQDKGLLLYFPDVSPTKTVLEELQELCEPFLRPRQPQPRLPQPRTPVLTPRSKRRKNQLKKVVCQVPVDGVSADVWAWRKYGQKPIKGSPFPRGYYRCSSSKGCPARKQVERSRTDPGTLVVTYTAEHNHPVPTHRNSLAGSTRHKISGGVTPKVNAESPPTIPSPSTEEKKEEEVEEDEEEDGMLALNDAEDFLADDNMMFVDFDSSPELFSTVFSTSPSWVANETATTATAAAGGF